MNIFVTVGTTRFDSLIVNLDKIFLNTKYNVIMQIANTDYRPKNVKYFRFINNIKYYFEKSDIIITHAGAGSIYEILELNKKVIIVPNLERIDKHQKDIADYMHTNNYAYTIYDINFILKAIEYVKNNHFNVFKKENFFVADEIYSYIIK
ncbi:PssE/Cps14G family polysaccharide biosynthesis glycosyltransferase [Campylobacter hominis]